MQVLQLFHHPVSHVLFWVCTGRALFTRPGTERIAALRRPRKKDHDVASGKVRAHVTGRTEPEYVSRNGDKDHRVKRLDV